MNGYSANTMPKHLKKDPDYYINGGDMFLLAENTVFCVNSHFLTQEESSVFRDSFGTPGTPGQPPNGTTESTAIVLENVKPSAFRSFLWCFYNPKYSLYNTSVEEWEAILHLAHHFKFPGVKELAIRELGGKDMPVVDRIILYQKYFVPRNYLVPLYAALCSQDEALSVQDSMKLGLEATVVIFQAREHLRARPEDGGKSPIPDDRQPDVLTVVTNILEQIPTSPGGTRNGANASDPRS